MGKRERWMGAALIELADVLDPGCDDAAYAKRVVSRLADLVYPAEVEMLMAAGDGLLKSAAATTERAARLAAQEELDGTGPCTLSYQTGRPALNQSISSLAAKWPQIAAASHVAGVRSISALPMRHRDKTIGVVGVLSVDEHYLTAADADLALLLIEAAAIGVLQRRVLELTARRAEQLQHALDSRVIIEQAKGLLAARLGISPETAFERLRSYARRRNLPLADLAAAAVRGDLTAADLQAAEV